MVEPIRVLHVFGRTDRGGAESFIMNVYRNIDRSKVQFDFMVHTMDKCAYDDEIISLGGRIFRVPRYNIVNHLRYKKEWNRFFKKNKNIKIVHGHMTSTGIIYLKIAKKYGAMAISHIHSTSAGKGFAAAIKGIMEHRVEKTSDYLFACSVAAGKWCYGEEVCGKSNFHVICNAIETEKYIYSPRSREVKRAELGLENKFVVGHIGRFDIQKNHVFLIDIFKNIYDKNPSAVLLLIGDGVLRNDIQKKVYSLGLNDNVIFTGVRSDIPDLLNAMDVFLFPSLSEGFGIVLIEAQTNGLHCIASDVIPQETRATELIEFISLDESASKWADKALEYVNEYERKNKDDEIKDAGYDIHYVSGWLKDFYLSCI